MQKKIFISYSWGTPEYNQWVVDLGERLMLNSVDVVLDRWSLKAGHDIYSFMEEMVKSDDVNKVLIICDKNYSQKADSRLGGVGTETQIITPNIYSHEKQEKFIPIVVERDNDEKPYLPTYLQSRLYIDFSNENQFESSYEELLRNILDAPSIPKPKLGNNIPAYITESNTNYSELKTLLRTLEHQLKKGSSINKKYLDDFGKSFKSKLLDYGEKTRGVVEIKKWGILLLDTLRSYGEEIRECYIEFVDVVSNYDIPYVEDFFIDFFSSKDSFLKDFKQTSNGDLEFFHIVFQELYIYTISILLRHEKFDLVGDLLHSKYYIPNYRGSIDKESFDFLYKHNRYFESHIKNNMNKTSGFGYYLANNISPNIKLEDLILGDVFCYITSYLRSDEEVDISRNKWFPKSYLYYNGNGFTFFKKLSSNRFFDRVKGVYDVESVFELKEKINLLRKNTNDSIRLRYGDGFEYVPFVFDFINVDEIGVNR